jgi:WD40 repeat protein
MTMIKVSLKLMTFLIINLCLGLIAVSSAKESSMIAFPGRQMGQIQIVDLNEFITLENSNRMVSTNFIPAHTTTLGCIAMDLDGKRLASASDKGTLIRVFDTKSGQLLHELRRGADRAEIYNIAFNMDASRLCVSSDKGTIHIFNLDTTESTPSNEETNR